MASPKVVKLVVIAVVLPLLCAVVASILFSSALAAEPNGQKSPAKEESATAPVAFAMAISVTAGALGAGYAVGRVGVAAIGAMSERPELMGRALVFVVIAEGIAVWGLVGAILLMGRL